MPFPLRLLTLSVWVGVLTGCSTVEIMDPPHPGYSVPRDGLYTVATGWDPYEDICEEVECRDPRRVILRLNNGEFYREEIVASPFVWGDSIYLLPGEGFYVEFERQGRKLVNLRYAAERTRLTDTLYVVYAQVQDATGRYVSSLSIDLTGFGRLAFDAFAYVPGSSTPRQLFPHTRVYNDSGFTQAWPTPFVQVVLTNFRVVQ